MLHTTGSILIHRRLKFVMCVSGIIQNLSQFPTIISDEICRYNIIRLLSIHEPRIEFQHDYLLVRFSLQKPDYTERISGYLLVQLSARWDFVYVMFYIDQSMKCGHTNKQTIVFTGLFSTSKKTSTRFN